MIMTIAPNGPLGNHYTPHPLYQLSPGTQPGKRRKKEKRQTDESILKEKKLECVKSKKGMDSVVSKGGGKRLSTPQREVKDKILKKYWLKTRRLGRKHTHPFMIFSRSWRSCNRRCSIKRKWLHPNTHELLPCFTPLLFTLIKWKGHSIPCRQTEGSWMRRGEKLSCNNYVLSQLEKRNGSEL